MIFILGDEKILIKSNYYDKNSCWDYPLEELDYVIETNDEPNMVYVVGEDKRIYETNCRDDEIYDLYNLYDELNAKTDLKKFELAMLSICLKLYIKYSKEIAMDRLEKWSETNEILNPNAKQIKENFEKIIKPFEEKKKVTQQNSKEYRVKIREVAELEIPVIAENMEDAINKAEQQYSDREVTFEYENYENLDIKATEIIKINRDEIGLNGDIYFSYDGIENFDKLQNTSIHELESEGEIVTMTMKENPLNVALIAEENTLYLISYLYNDDVKEVEHIDNYKIDINTMNEENFKNAMYNYYIDIYFQYLNYIEEYGEEENEQ